MTLNDMFKQYVLFDLDATYDLIERYKVVASPKLKHKYLELREKGISR